MTVVWSLALALGGLAGALLYMVPALLLALPLCFGPSVGEEKLAELAERLHRSTVVEGKDSLRSSHHR